MRAIGEHDNEISIGAESKRVTRLAMIEGKGDSTGIVSVDFAEKIDVGDDIAEAEAVFSQFDEEIIVRVAMKIVSSSLIG
jgi:hypothetical protein